MPGHGRRCLCPIPGWSRSPIPRTCPGSCAGSRDPGSCSTRSRRRRWSRDRKSTRLNSSHTVIYTLSLHDALPISRVEPLADPADLPGLLRGKPRSWLLFHTLASAEVVERSEEHTSELQSHSDLHSFPTRRSSDLPGGAARRSRGLARAPAREAAILAPVPHARVGGGGRGIALTRTPCKRVRPHASLRPRSSSARPLRHDPRWLAPCDCQLARRRNPAYPSGTAVRGRADGPRGRRFRAAASALALRLGPAQAA